MEIFETPYQCSSLPYSIVRRTCDLDDQHPRVGKIRQSGETGLRISGDAREKRY